MDNYLEIAGTCVGLIYLWLEYKASIYLWIVGIVMPAIYIFVYYEAGLYADFAINIYYLLATAYGWLSWKYGRKGGRCFCSVDNPYSSPDLCAFVLGLCGHFGIDCLGLDRVYQ